MKNNRKIYIFYAIVVFCIACVSVCYAETVNLEWDAPTSGGSVDGYNLYYGLTDDISTMTKIEGISELNYRLEGLDLHKIYYFYVRAYNSSGEGPVSDVRMSDVSLRIVE